MANTSITFHQFFVLLILLSSSFLRNATVKLGYCCSEAERNALLKFKSTLVDPSSRLSSWVGRDCCGWIGVNCHNSTGNVIKLRLGSLNPSDHDGEEAVSALGGEINPSLLGLQYLRYLDLSENNFGGIPIPSFIGSLKTLRYLNLSGASFAGTIPPSLGNLSRLLYLDLSSYSNESNSENDLNWLPGLSSLRYLNLGSVDLSNAGANWFRAVNMLPSLLELHLPRCGLPNLPPSLPLVNLTSISVLDLSNNGLNSSIPSWLFNSSTLVYLDLSSNDLQGEISEGFPKLHSLQYLDLSENSFIGGKLSRNLGNLCSLRVLDISYNNITGQITEFVDGLSECANCSLEFLNLGINSLAGSLPNSLGSLHHLKYLLLTQNFFSGSIPETIGSLLSLEEFYLSFNLMKSIPVSLGQLSSLVNLDFSENPWEGVLTEAHFSNLTRLKELYITTTNNSVSLVMNVSFKWNPPFKLTYLNLKSCLVGPEFPSWLRNQNELTSVAIWHAGISGPIPDWFWKLDLFLHELDFSYNQLTGTIPDTITFQAQSDVFLNQNLFSGPLPLFSSNVSSLHLDHNFFSGHIPPDFGDRMPLLTDIDISHNSLSGSIPMSVGSLNLLLTFHASNNKLSGKIPDVWNNMPQLYLIDFANNSLSGPIPTSFGSLSYLMYLSLSDNNLVGQIPSSLQNCSIIQTLDLGDNRLSGNIPRWIALNMPSLLLLSLRSNLFVGDIPPQLCVLSSLHILDLADNNLSGHIPGCVGNLSGMTYILTSERYEGQLEVVAKGRTLLYGDTLYLVNSIDLSNNNLSGVVPETISNLSRLGTLNLSMNWLTGGIPEGIGDLRWLETLDLSRNQLSGTIPTSMASITSLNHLNLSHNNLSGKIPTTNQFLTFNDPSIYEGNPGLCGLPLPTKCEGDEDKTSQPAASANTDENTGEDQERLWFFIGTGVGFFMSFWGVCGTLIFSKSWRDACFGFADRVIGLLIVILFVNLARLRRMINRKPN